MIFNSDLSLAIWQNIMNKTGLTAFIQLLADVMCIEQWKRKVAIAALINGVTINSALVASTIEEYQLSSPLRLSKE